MTTARVAPMPDAQHAEWRRARAEGGAPLPDAAAGGRLEAVGLTVDDVVVGGALLEHLDDRTGRCCAVRVLQTTLPHDAAEHWSVLLAALEAYARARGAHILTTAVAPDLAGVFGAAGFRATMTTVGKRLDPTSATELQDDRRVEVRAMTDAERAVFVDDVGQQLRAGMARAGVADADSARLDALDQRLTRLRDAPSPDELLVTGTVDGVPVGRAWATLVAHDGALDFHGNTLDLFPEHRGQGLTPSFLGALRRMVQEIGVRDVHLRVYGHDVAARSTFLEEGAEVRDVHLRKDLVDR